MRHFVCAQFPILHLLIRYELQRFVAHAVSNILDGVCTALVCSGRWC